MKKSTISLLVTSMLLSTPLLSKERLVIYDNYGYIFSSTKQKVAEKYLLEIPNSVDSSSLNIDFIFNDINIPIVEKVIQNNSIKTLYYQNIGKNIKFYINQNLIEGRLISISNNFIKVHHDLNNFYYNISAISGIKFEKDFNFSNKVVDIYLQNSEEKEVEVNYSAKFTQISWNPTYRFLINDKNNTGYFDYDITLSNNSSYHFKNVGLELLSGKIYQTNNYNRHNEALMDMSYSSGGNSKSSFNNFSGYQKLTFDNNVNLEPFSSTTYPYISNKELEYKKNFTFQDHPSNNFENKNVQIEIHIERNNKKEHFPLMSGQISVFNGLDNFNSTFIGSANIGTKSSSEDIKFSIGESQNIFMSKKVDTKKVRYYNPSKLNNTNSYVSVHHVSMSITNDEENKVSIKYNLNKNNIIVTKEVYNSGESIENIINNNRKNNKTTFTIDKESTSKFEFIIIEV